MPAVAVAAGCLLVVPVKALAPARSSAEPRSPGTLTIAFVVDLLDAARVLRPGERSSDRDGVGHRLAAGPIARAGRSA